MGTLDIANLSLVEDLADPANMGSAFVSVVPGSVRLVPADSTAAVMPVFDGSFDGGLTNAEMFNGASGLLAQRATSCCRVPSDAEFEFRC